MVNPLTHNGSYSGRTAPLTSKRCISYIYSTNIGIKYFKRGIYSPFFPLQNAVCFIILTYLVPVLFIFYIQGVLKFKKNHSGAKMLSSLLMYFEIHWLELDRYNVVLVVLFSSDWQIFWINDNFRKQNSSIFIRSCIRRAGYIRKDQEMLPLVSKCNVHILCQNWVLCSTKKLRSSGLLRSV